MIYPIHTLIAKITEQLEAVFHDTAAAEHAAWWLLQKITTQPQLALVVSKAVPLSDADMQQLDQWLYEMVHDHKPLAYILGTVPFLSLTLEVEPPILIPRPETEEWCATLIRSYTGRMTPQDAILDLCTGSGCIALALAQAFPQTPVIAADIEPQALALTARNALRNTITTVTTVLSDVYEKVTGTYTLIVANPPYITDTEWRTVELSVKNWEDHKALIAPDNGLAVIKKIISGAHKHLAPNGELWIEIGYHQGQSVRDLFAAAGFTDITVRTDYTGNDRVVCGRL